MDPSLYLFLLLAILSSSCILSIADESIHYEGSRIFSGVYRPDIRLAANDFSAAWLLSKERLIISEPTLKRAENMAGASFAVVRHFVDPQYTTSSTCVVTRDMFDYFVEHLSSTSNQIPHSNTEIMNEQRYKLEQTTHLLQHEHFYQHNIDKRLNQTLAILIFSSIAFSVPQSVQQQKDIRLSYFLTTFFGVYRYYKHILVYVSCEKDRQLLLRHAPHGYFPAMEIRIKPVGVDYKNRTIGLPRESLLDLIHRLQDIPNNRELSPFQYVYFSEGDQILHMRHIKELYNIIDDTHNKAVIVPHRMNTMPLVQDLPTSLHDIFEPDSAFRINDVKLIIEDLFHPRGSCCENGRYEVAPCEGWWYQCKQWGLRNISPWFKFGNYGFTFPAATEHRGRCIYSPQKHLCDLPQHCPMRSLQRSVNGSAMDLYNLCGPHYEIVEQLGPLNDEQKEQIKAMKAISDKNREREREREKSIQYHDILSPSVSTTSAFLHDIKWNHTDNNNYREGMEEVQQLQYAEQELQWLLTEVTRIRKHIRTNRHQLKQMGHHVPHHNSHNNGQQHQHGQQYRREKHKA